MFPLIETAAAFAAVMLVTSLFISAVVQVLQNLIAMRPQILGGMLTTLARAYREAKGLSALAAQEERDFVHAILGHHLLHTPDGVAKAGGDPAKLAAQIDYLHKDDLVDIVRDQIARVKEGVTKVVDDADAFEKFVARWYDNIGATASQRFKQNIRRITVVVSCVVVAGFNLDGIHLIADLYRDQTARSALLSQVDSIRQTAVRLGEVAPTAADASAPADAVRRDASVQDLAGELRKTSDLLEEPSLGIGWQNGWIVKRWSAYEGARARGVDGPMRAHFVADAFLWIAGLVFSLVMLSLGAPFWATTLGNLVNAGNAVQKWKHGTTKAEKKSGT